ncbi:MAG: hypothetical protein RR369_00800 [Lachnospiraceae bacterium]
MGNNKGKNVIFTLAGAYLMYTGGKLFMDVNKARPNHYGLLMAASVAFFIIGIGVIVFYMKDYFKHETIEEESTEEEPALEEEPQEVPVETAAEEEPEEPEKLEEPEELEKPEEPKE